MKTLNMLVLRNTKMFFKDKGMFFTSLITPIILLVLNVTFLANVYRETFASALPDFLQISDKLLNGMVGGQMVSSLLAVSCVTVSFCSNMLMVQDRVNGTIKDLSVSPVKRSVLAVSYYVSSALSTLIVCFVAAIAAFVYLYKTGWYLSFYDILLIFGDIILLVLFGTALSSLVNFFLTSQGQISAVGTIVSSGYGFICGAYMPISQFSTGLQRVISFLPGTYGTSLVRNHALRGVFAQMQEDGFPQDAINSIKDAVDCNLYFFGNSVSVSAMYTVLISTVFVLTACYILVNVISSKKTR